MKYIHLFICLFFCNNLISQSLIDEKWKIFSNQIIVEVSNDTVDMYQRNNTSIYDLDNIEYEFINDTSYVGTDINGIFMSGNWGFTLNNDSIILDNIKSYFEFSSDTTFFIMSDFQFVDTLGEFQPAKSIIKFTSGDITTRLNNVEYSDNFIISPNPSDGNVRIELKDNSTKLKSYKVYNSFGSLVLEANNFDFNGESAFTLNLSNHPTGIYYISFLLEESYVTKRILICK